MEERREFRRLQMELPARWESAQVAHSAVILNGSPHGCFVRTQVEEPEDGTLKLGIRLPHGEWISLLGEVAYYLPTEGFGFQFTCSPDGSDPMFEKWIEYLWSLRKDITGSGEAEVTAGLPTVSVR